MNYGANTYMFKRVLPAVQESSIVSTSMTYMIMDAGTYTLEPWEATNAWYDTSSPNYLPGTGAAGASDVNIAADYKADFNNGRHFGGVNMVFTDGHVKWLKSAIVMKQANNLHDGLATAWNPANSG